MTSSNPNPSRPGAKAFPKWLRIEMAPLQTEGNDIAFTLASGTAGLVTSDQPQRISLVGIKQPVLLTIRLVGSNAGGMLFHDDPFQAMSFAKGVVLPPGPGNTASGMFSPLGVSPDRLEVTFLAANPGDGQDYRAKFTLTAGTSLTALASGGPIIIND